MYVPPTITDLGDLVALTEATSLFGEEDGASKLVPMHHVPAPTAPAQP